MGKAGFLPLASETDLQSAYSGQAVAQEYIGRRFTNELNRLLHDRQAAAVQRVIDRTRPQRILEIAPGPGRLTRAIRPTGLMVCLEYNEGMIEQGRSACAGVQWVRGNGFRLPFGQGFNLVYSFRFVRHFHRPDREQLYREIRRVLDPGGYFVMDAVNEAVSRPLREAHPEEYPIYDKLYRSEELYGELAEAGFDAIELNPVQRCYRWQYRSQTLLGPRVNWLNRVVIRALECLAGRGALEWVVSCRRA